MMRRSRTQYGFPWWNFVRGGVFPTVTSTGQAPSGVNTVAAAASTAEAAPNYGQLYHAYLNSPARAAQFHGQLGETKFFTDRGGQSEVSVPHGRYSGPQQIEI